MKIVDNTVKLKFFSLFLGLAILACSSCKKDTTIPITLQEYIDDNADFQTSDELIACATGIPEGWMGDVEHPTSVFFYPITGAYEFRYFETEGPVDNIYDYTAFDYKELDDEPVFNGKLWRFKNTAFSGSRWGIVTYKVNNTLHICRAINLKTNSIPTEIAPDLIDITENGTTPLFEWEDGLAQDNVIYFQVVSDTLGNIVSGTYTTDKYWQFYDTSNVVLNVHDVTPTPSLQPNETYMFTLMSVSYDNWVNLTGQKRFNTN